MGQEQADQQFYADDIDDGSENRTALQTNAQRDAGERLQASRAAARDRYATIAVALKAEAGVRRHFHHNIIGGLAFSGLGKILALAGVTRRQLYVLAHECGHILLHSTPETQCKPSHVKEHEAETYAHRAFARYGLEVPEKSAKWARAYVGQWIMKDRQAGIAICAMAAEFASGRRSPSDPLSSVDGQPPKDFSSQIEKFTAKGVQLVQTIEAQTPAAELNKEEQAMLAEIKKHAARLGRKKVEGAFAALAQTIEAVERAKREHSSALPAIARGMEALQRIESIHRKSRSNRVRSVLRGHEYGGSRFFLGSFVFMAAAALMIGMAGTNEAFYYAGFFAIAAGVTLAYLIVAILTE